MQCDVTILILRQRNGLRAAGSTATSGAACASQAASISHVSAVYASKRLSRGGVQAESGGGGVQAEGGGGVETEGDGGVEVDYKRAFWTATIGGARALGLEEHLGHLGVGMQFDALTIDCAAATFDTFDTVGREGQGRSLADDFERFVNLGDDRNVKRVFVRGWRAGGWAP